jgi:hypothetical protein
MNSAAGIATELTSDWAAAAVLKHFQFVSVAISRQWADHHKPQPPQPG